MVTAYVKTKRDKVSQCNICRRKASLSWDHVPPKGGVNLTSVEQQTVIERLTSTQENSNISISQNGVKFRTICKECNEALGEKYDPSLNSLALEVGKLLKTTLHFPPVVHIETRPVAVMRAILGHILAAKAEIDNSIYDQKVRSFLFDENQPIPTEIKIFYWVYPFNSVVILRDVAMPAIRGKFNKFGFFNILKYFPIAYLITDLHKYEGLDELTTFRNLQSQDSAKIPINLKHIRNHEWPEIVDDTNLWMGTRSINSSVYAVPRKKKI